MGYFFPEERMGYAKRTAAQRSRQLQEEERLRSAASDARVEREAAARERPPKPIGGGSLDLAPGVQQPRSLLPNPRRRQEGVR